MKDEKQLSSLLNLIYFPLLQLAPRLLQALTPPRRSGYFACRSACDLMFFYFFMIDSRSARSYDRVICGHHTLFH
jgi:hypothetical protein